MNGDPYAPIRAVTCALEANGTRLGTGVLIDRRLVLTCRHVVEGADVSRLQAVFPAGPQGEIGASPQFSDVALAELSSEGLDLALLHMTADPAADLHPVPLGRAAFDEPFLCWGFPEVRDKRGVIPCGVAAGLGRRGVVLAPTGTGSAPRLQLHSKLEIHPGLSGSPIVQMQPFRLVALMASSVAPHDEGLAVPTALLPVTFPTLAARVFLEPSPPPAGKVPSRIVALGQTRARLSRRF